MLGENYENFKNLYAEQKYYFSTEYFRLLQNVFKILFPCHCIEFSYNSYGANRSWYCSRYPSKVKSEKKKKKKEEGLLFKIIHKIYSRMISFPSTLE